MKRRIIPIYGLAVHFARDLEDARKFLAVAGEDEDLLDGCDGIYLTFGGTRLMCVFNGGHHTLAHESVHAAWEVLDFCGIQVSQENDEALAYLAGWFSEAFGKAFPAFGRG